MIVEIPGKVNLDLDVLPLGDLVPHEDIIPSLRDSVVRDLERSGYQRDPIIVDKKTNVVLDGMHRRAALEQVGAKFAVCATFDYYDEKIILERWIRHFLSPDRKMIDEMIDLFELFEVVFQTTLPEWASSRTLGLVLSLPFPLRFLQGP